MSYRGMETPRHQMPRAKGRGPMYKHSDHLPPATRPRYMPQSPYPQSVGFAPRTGAYPTIHSPDFQQVQYPQQVQATAVWSPTIPMSEGYQISGQHAYPPQQQIYNADPSHMVTLQNATFVSQVQNQNEFDPIANVCVCSKCGFPNALAHIQLKSYMEANKRLQEDLEAERQQNANYEESVRSSPASQATVSSLSADAQPFHMAATQGPKPPQGTDVNKETSTDASSRLHNPNGNDYSHRTARNWQSQGDTPVVSASDVVNNQFNESTASDSDWNNVSDLSQHDSFKTDTSGHRAAEDTSVTEPLNISANEDWDLCEGSQQEANVHTTPDVFKTQNKHIDDNTPDKEHTTSTPYSDGYTPVKNDRYAGDSSKPRQKDRFRPSRNKGGRNEVPENEGRRSTNHRGSVGFRPSSPQDHKDRRVDWRQDKKEGSSREFSRSGGRGGGGGGGSRRAPPSNVKVITEIDGDLFSAPEESSLAHCVGADLRMGSGIAVRFRQQFKNVEELFDQKKGVGEVAVLEDKNRFIFNLITKERSNGKPTWGNFSSAVEELRRLCVEKGVKQLALPKIGCGLDRLEWRDVRKLLETTFADTSIALTVYNLQQTEELESPAAKSKSSIYFMHERKNLVDIAAETGLLFLCTEEWGTMDKTLESLDRKHKILHDLRSSKKSVGDVIAIQKGKEYLYGLVVKKNERDPFSYVNFGKCLRKLRNMNNKEMYGYFGMEAFRDGDDPLTMEKVITCFRNTFGGIQYSLELYICWPKEVEEDYLWEENNATRNSK